jgi:hypothetical protein
MQFWMGREVDRTVDMQLTMETAGSIRTRMDLLLAQYMLLRGEDRRRAEFPDLFTVDSLYEGVKADVPMLVLLLGQGKVLISLHHQKHANVRQDKSGGKGSVWSCILK